MEKRDYYVERVGEGEPIIFLPAGGFAGNEGLNIAEHLSINFETHMIDLPGIGKSNGITHRITSLKLANWVKEYLDKQQIEKVFLIGHSLGGAILLSFAIHYPEKVKKLILLDQGHKPFPRIPISEFGHFAFTFPLLNIGVKFFGRGFLKKLAPFFKQEDEEDDIDNTLKEFCDRVSIEQNNYVRTAIKESAGFTIDGLNLMFGYYNLNLPKMLKQIKVRTYLVYGTFESIDEKEHTKTLNYIHKIKKYNLPIKYRPVNGGHYVHWSDSLLLNDIKSFLNDFS